MTEYDHYLFDLNGYLVLKGALSPELVAAMNEAIDQHRDQIKSGDPSRPWTAA